MSQDRNTLGCHGSTSVLAMLSRTAPHRTAPYRTLPRHRTHTVPLSPYLPTTAPLSPYRTAPLSPYRTAPHLSHRTAPYLSHPTALHLFQAGAYARFHPKLEAPSHRARCRRAAAVMALPTTTDGGSGSQASASARASAAINVSGPRGPETSTAAIDVGGWHQFPRRALSETYDTSSPRLPRAVQPYRFFVYSGALNQSWLRLCHGFNALERSTATEKLGEVRLYDALERHRLRTHNASQATFFFTPLWEYTSWALGRCRGTTHTERMAAAAEQLAASPHYQRHGGRDHIWGTTASTIDGAVLNERLQPLTPLLRWAVAGRYKPFEAPKHNFDSGSSGGKCVIQLPFPVCHRGFKP